jgi:type VI secretion system protein ImpH
LTTRDDSTRQSRLEAVTADPTSHDLFKVLREIERNYPEKPRVGDSTVLSEEMVRFEQDPFLSFPPANIFSASVEDDGRLRMTTRFLGMFGPQGALPLHVTEMASEWLRGRDPSFARFVDIFSTRFQQLFFRAWADARPVAQNERPSEDRFLVYLASIAGFGSPAFRQHDTVSDQAKVAYAGLAGMQVKSAQGLTQLIRGIFEIDVEVVEWIGTWLEFEPEDRMRIGLGAASLGMDSFLGRGVYTINDRIRLKIRCRDLNEYEDFLPSGKQYKQLTDLVFFYLGYRQEVEMQLGIDEEMAPRVSLGKSGRLGWTSWIKRDAEAVSPRVAFDARFRI